MKIIKSKQNNMQEKIKTLRLRLDMVTQLTKNLNISREISLSITTSQLSKMWLGRVLEAYNHAYEQLIILDDDTDEFTNDNILSFAGTPDHNTPDNKDWRNLEHIEKVEWLSDEMLDILFDIEEIVFNDIKIHNKNNPVQAIHEYIGKEALKYCTESEMWLDEEYKKVEKLERKIN